jgi:hypothetical protein
MRSPQGSHDLTWASFDAQQRRYLYVSIVHASLLRWMSTDRRDTRHKAIARKDDVTKTVLSPTKTVTATRDSAADAGLPEKNPHAAALGRLGGLKGGRARANSLSAARRRAIARKAARARWNRTKT